MSMFALGTIDPLLVATFSGFDRPGFVSRVRLLGDGTTGPHEVIQGSGIPFRTATITGTLVETLDLAALRGYDLSKEEVGFTDSNGNATTVRVIDLTTDDFKDYWTFTATLIDAGGAIETAGVGQVRAGLDTTLAADPALGATNLKVASVTTVTAGDFIRVGAAAVTATVANSEVLRVLTVGTTGSGGTGLDIGSDTGGGTTIDFASADEVKTVTGTLLSSPASASSVTIKVDSVTGLGPGDAIRLGYLDHYETRTLTDIGTAGAGGTGITFAVPLARDHSLGEWVVEVET